MTPAGAEVNSDFWLEELRSLRAGAPAERYKARVRRMQRAPWELPPIFFAYRMLTRGRETDRTDVCLYALTAARGDLPLVVVSVSAAADLALVEDEGVVPARGVPKPGHALVLEVAGELVPPLGPAWLPTIFRSRFRL